MADIVDPTTRSRMMSGIGNKDTKPELAVRRFLHRHGLRFRLHSRTLPGKPDIVLPKYHTVVFVHGCFWHRHPRCRYAYMPKQNRAFWRKKFDQNVARDKATRSRLRKLGWTPLVIWECNCADERTLIRLIERIKALERTT